MKNAFREHRFLLTAAISAISSTIDMAYDIPKISKYLDYIHVMAYDYHGAWNKQVLPNSPLRSKDRLDVVRNMIFIEILMYIYAQTYCNKKSIVRSSHLIL